MQTHAGSANPHHCASFRRPESSNEDLAEDAERLNLFKGRKGDGEIEKEIAQDQLETLFEADARGSLVSRGASRQ